ncbi:hypothetical protein OG288_26065 [Streptomyces tauricus]|uniref:Lipoprotein n=1 Tax=Streptomyces tauricus TaxID=68274 RepID=A0ABZ1JIM0_9ACTN|nr:hypothetical protein [Streptomyces tauricus]
MNRRRPTLLAAFTLTAAATLTLSACGGASGSKGKAEADDKVASADTGTRKSPSPSASASAAAERPKIELPSDLTYTFEWAKTGDREKDAVLADREQSIKAVDLAIAHQDPLDKAYLYFYEGEAAAQTQKYIEAYVKAEARTIGAYRYYGEVVDVSDADSASLVYCEDQSKGYDMYLKPKRIDKTAVTRNSYVLYSTRLSKNDKGAWVVEELTSQRGSAKCQP